MSSDESSAPHVEYEADDDLVTIGEYETVRACDVPKLIHDLAEKIINTERRRIPTGARRTWFDRASLTFEREKRGWVTITFKTHIHTVRGPEPTPAEMLLALRRYCDAQLEEAAK